MTLLAAEHDTIAVEAQYHNSYYRKSTGMSSANTIVATGTKELQESILCALIKQIDLLLFDRKQICHFTEITFSKCSKIGIEYVTESEKKNLKRKLK